MTFASGGYLNTDQEKELPNVLEELRKQFGENMFRFGFAELTESIEQLEEDTASKLKQILVSVVRLYMRY